jgi:hypothetical protein
VCLNTTMHKARGNHCIKKISQVSVVDGNCCKPILTIENNEREMHIVRLNRKFYHLYHFTDTIFNNAAWYRQFHFNFRVFISPEDSQFTRPKLVLKHIKYNKVTYRVFILKRNRSFTS